ncbi:MAG: bacteriocin [Bacilli bacterium]|nr:bacteriocin [Bacilli bacterium]
MNVRKELLRGLTEDQIAKVRDFDDPNDLLQLAKDEGVELNEEQLNAISGGGCSNDDDTTTKQPS